MVMMRYNNCGRLAVNITKLLNQDQWQIQLDIVRWKHYAELKNPHDSLLVKIRLENLMNSDQLNLEFILCGHNVNLWYKNLIFEWKG